MANLPKIGNSVSIKNPTTGEPSGGYIADLVWVYEPHEFGEAAEESDQGWLETAFMAQLIRWATGEQAIRFCYYTRRPGLDHNGWVYAQFAPIMSLEETRVLLKKIEDRGWLTESNVAAFTHSS